jgi:hypothetical protein
MYTKSQSENDATSETTNIPLKKERVLRTFNSNRRVDNQAINNLNMRGNRRVNENRKLFDILNRSRAPTYTPIRINRLMSPKNPCPNVKKVTFNENSIPIPPPLPPSTEKKQDIKDNNWYKDGASVVDTLFRGLKEPSHDVIINKNDIVDENVEGKSNTISELNENMNKMFNNIFRSIDDSSKQLNESSSESESSSMSVSSSESESESSDSETSSESTESSSVSNEWQLPTVPSTVPNMQSVCKLEKVEVDKSKAIKSEDSKGIKSEDDEEKFFLAPGHHYGINTCIKSKQNSDIEACKLEKVEVDKSKAIKSEDNKAIKSEDNKAIKSEDNKAIKSMDEEKSFLAAGYNYGIDTSIKSKQFSDIENDWIAYNSMVNKKTVSCSEPVAASQSMSSNFASYTAFGGESLLNNEGDIQRQNTYQDKKNNDVKLSTRVNAKNIKILNDNFAETNNHIISPSYMVEELMKVKGRLMKLIEIRSTLKAANERLRNDKLNQPFQQRFETSRQYQPFQQSSYNSQPSYNPHAYNPVVNEDKVQLTDISSNPKIIEKLREQYSKMYQAIEFAEDTTSLFRYNPSFSRNGNSLGYESKNLLSVLDFLIGKYRSLGDDRKILDMSDDIGYEIKDVVEEYMVVKEKLERLDKFNKKLNAGRELLKELDQMTNDFGTDSLLSKVHLDMYLTMKNTVSAQIDTLEKSLVDTEINALKKEAEEVQAKFNYYQKMANEVTSRLQIITTQPLNELATYDLRPKKDTDPMTIDNPDSIKSSTLFTSPTFDTFSPYPNWDTFVIPGISKLNDRMYL